MSCKFLPRLSVYQRASMFGYSYFLNKGDHLSSNCNIANSEGHCYFHEIVEHFSVCKHMLLMKSHPVEKCMFCNKSLYLRLIHIHCRHRQQLRQKFDAPSPYIVFFFAATCGNAESSARQTIDFFCFAFFFFVNRKFI